MPSALDQLTYVAIGYAVLVALAALVVTVRRVERPQLLDNGVWILEVLMAVRVVAGIGTMLDGQRPASLGTHVGYLVAAVCVLPIAMQSISDDRGPWSSGVITVGAVAVAVIAVRLRMTAAGG